MLAQTTSRRSWQQKAITTGWGAVTALYVLQSDHQKVAWMMGGFG
jgi:hypothetical protein